VAAEAEADADADAEAEAEAEAEAAEAESALEEDGACGAAAVTWGRSVSAFLRDLEEQKWVQAVGGGVRCSEQAFRWDRQVILEQSWGRDLRHKPNARMLAVLCCAVLCCAVLCCAVLCCDVLCCAALRWR
jgi:hypothetical protein